MNTDWSNIGTVGFVVVMAAYFMFSYRKKFNNHRLGQAVETCIDALYRHAYVGLLKTETSEKASRLAGCAVNELFGFDMSSEAAKEFMAENKGRVQSLVAELVKDPEARPLAGATVHFISSPPLAKQMRKNGGLLRATNIGLINPTEKPMPVSKYLAQTATFHRKSVKASEEKD